MYLKHVRKNVGEEEKARGAGDSWALRTTGMNVVVAVVYLK
jgi:hypothetical protein